MYSGNESFYQCSSIRLKESERKSTTIEDYIMLVLQSLWILGKTTSHLLLNIRPAKQNRIFTKQKLLRTQELSYYV